jgi:hypothetical protein
MYFNHSFYAELPFAHLTVKISKMENEKKYFNLLIVCLGNSELGGTSHVGIA